MHPSPVFTRAVLRERLLGGYRVMERGTGSWS